MSARTDNGVQGDVTAIGSMIGDDFHVEDVSVRVGDHDDAPSLTWPLRR